jgi:hypothetical protein
MNYKIYGYWVGIFLLGTACVNEPTIEHDSAPAPIQKEVTTLEEEKSTSISAEKTKEVWEWTGTINKTIKVHGDFEIINDREGEEGDVLKGVLVYDKVGKPITLIGKIRDNYIRLLEVNKEGDVTGMMSGKYEEGVISNAYWYSPAREKEMEWNVTTKLVTKKQTPLQPLEIEGRYSIQYGEAGGGGFLEVKKLDETTIQFDISNVTGAPSHHIAAVEEGKGKLEKGNTVVYDMTYYESLEEGERKCIFKIRFFDGLAVVDYVDDHSNCIDFGHNAGVEGLYYKVKE